MTWYTLTQIAASYNQSIDTTRRFIKQFVTDGKFQKKTPGKKYSQDELKKLEKLLGFKYREQG